MLIINNNKTSIINLSHIDKIFIGGDGLSIKVDFSNGKGTQFERYNSIEETKIAIKMLCDAICENKESFVMPDEKRIKAIIIQESPITNNSNSFRGRKAKGYGKS